MRNQIPHDVLVGDDFKRHPVLVYLTRNRRCVQGRETAHDLIQAGLGHVHLQTDLGLGFARAAQEHEQVLGFLLLPVVLPGLSIGDESRRRLEHRFNDPQPVGTKRIAGLGAVDDGVGDPGNPGFYLGGAPRVLYFGLDPVLLQKAPGGAYEFADDTLALQILDRANG